MGLTELQVFLDVRWSLHEELIEGNIGPDPRVQVPFAEEPLAADLIRRESAPLARSYSAVFPICKYRAVSSTDIHSSAIYRNLDIKRYHLLPSSANIVLYALNPVAVRVTSKMLRIFFDASSPRHSPTAD